MDTGLIRLEDRLHQLTVAPAPTASMRHPAGRRNSESSAFRSGGSTAASSTSGASLASNASSHSDTSHGSWGPKATFIPLEASAHASKISYALESLPGCSASLQRVVRELALTYDAEIEESVSSFNDVPSVPKDWEASRVLPVRPSAGERLC